MELRYIRYNRYMRYSRTIMVIIALICAVAGGDMQACLTTFINDGSCKVIIYNKVDKLLIPVEKNEKRRFGSHDTHASFAIYMPKPKVRSFTCMYTCKQNECGSNGTVQLKLSDVEKNVGAAELFTIVKHEPHVSMVQKLPMLRVEE